MTNPAIPTDPKSAGNDPSQTGEPAVAALSLEDKLQGLWAKNRELVVGLCVLVFLGIVGRAGWTYFTTQRELNVEREYAEATTHDGLQAFADAHADNPLGGIAELRLADEAYAAHQLTAALAGYDKAAATLKSPILIARAQLGSAIAKIESGQAADGEQGLKQLADDPKQFQALRAEAAYHLASLAAAQGQADQVKQLSEQLMQIDPSSPWTQRAFALQASLPAAPASAPAPTAGAAGAAPAVSFQLQQPK
jgi:hypothetical protein